MDRSINQKPRGKLPSIKLLIFCTLPFFRFLAPVALLPVLSYVPHLCANSLIADSECPDIEQQPKTNQQECVSHSSSSPSPRLPLHPQCPTQLIRRRPASQWLRRLRQTPELQQTANHGLYGSARAGRHDWTYSVLLRYAKLHSHLV